MYKANTKGGVFFMEYKTCKRCKEKFPATFEYFSREKTGKYCLRSNCKECRKEMNKPYKRDFYKRNKESEKERVRIYGISHKEVINIKSHRYRARKKCLPATLTLEDWETIKESFNYKCAYCGLSEEEHLDKYNTLLHQEHFIPLSKGGEYTHNNIIPSCKGCNCSKNDKDFFEWYPRQEFYNKEREKKILKYLNYKDKNNQQSSIS